MAVRPGRLATSNLRTGYNPKEDGENQARNHPQGQKEYKLDPHTEWCGRHYQEHKRKQTQMGGSRGEETWQQMDNQSHRIDTPWT